MSRGTDSELRRLAEEAIYSAKGHFKSADWISWSVFGYVTVPLLTSLVIFVFDPVELVEKSLALIGAVFSVLALSSIWANRSDKAERAVQGHMALGNSYLELYKEMRERSSGGNIPKKVVREFRQRLSALDNETSKARIGVVGRYWAKWRIHSEVDLDWLR